MWNVKTNVKPVIIGDTGTISKSFRKYLSNMSGKHEIKGLQQTAILGTAYVIRKVLMQKYKTFILRNNITCNIHVHYTHIVAVILYFLKTYFSRYITVKSLHKNNTL
jgi:hypothetical protein